MNRALLDWAVLAVSFYNTISLLWLGWMVLLAGNRRSAGTWLTGAGLLLGALFFTSHTAILGRGLGSTSLGMDFWWWLSWMPAVVAPLAWYLALLWYSGYRLDRPHPHHGWVILVSVLAGSIGLLLFFANPLPTYDYVAGRIFVLTPHLAGIPLLILVYIAYSLLCYLLPFDLLRHTRSSSELGARMRRRAQPWIIGASLALLLAGILLTWTALWAIASRPLPSLTNPVDEQIVKLFDLAVAGLVAVAITLLGRAIVSYEVFTGHPLPRNRFYHQWRRTVILAAGFGLTAGGTLSIGLRPVYSLMLATGLMTLFYALYTWRTYAEREEFMDRLRPFVASQDLYGRLTSPQTAASQDPSVSTGKLFQTLCLDVLEVQKAILVPTGALAALAGPPLIFPEGSNPPIPQAGQWAGKFTRQSRCLPAAEVGMPDQAEWAIPLWSARGLDGVLFLHEKNGRNPFTEEEIEIAQAAGERLLDLLAGAELARLSMNLLGQRLAQTRVIDGQARRVLHDEVLPDLHTALLYLSERANEFEERQPAMQALAQAHRRISDLMREMPITAPHRLAQNGLAAALQSMLDNDFSRSFSRISLAIQPEAAQQARDLPLYASEALFFAARELVRNAAVHGRGDQPDRDLHLTFSMTCDPQLCLVVEDDGVGYQPDIEPVPTNTRGSGKEVQSGAGSGLRIHSAILAAVGASLEISTVPHGGTRAVIRVREF